MSEVCEVCGKEASSLRKHCVGKWLNNADDLKHLVLALKLQPGAFAYLKENLEEVRDTTGTEGRERLLDMLSHRDATGADQGGSRLRQRICR